MESVRARDTFIVSTDVPEEGDRVAQRRSLWYTGSLELRMQHELVVYRILYSQCVIGLTELSVIPRHMNSTMSFPSQVVWRNRLRRVSAIESWEEYVGRCLL